MTGGSGALVFGAGGIAARFSGGLSLVVPGMSVTGDFSLAINRGTTAVNVQVDLGEETVSLDLPGGPYLRVEGTGIVLTIAGQRITGNVRVTR